MTIKPLIPSVAVAAAVAAVVTVILPLQSFLGNESLYPFGIARLSVELGVAFAAATAVFSALFAVVGRRCRGADTSPPPLLMRTTILSSAPSPESSSANCRGVTSSPHQLVCEISPYSSSSTVLPT